MPNDEKQNELDELIELEKDKILVALASGESSE